MPDDRERAGAEEAERSDREFDAAGWKSIRGLEQEVVSVREEIARRRAPLGRAVDQVGVWLSSTHFFVTLALLHAAWVALNLPFVPWRPWDPYPFVFLATFASVEAPFIAILVLMRSSRTDTWTS